MIQEMDLLSLGFHLVALRLCYHLVTFLYTTRVMKDCLLAFIVSDGVFFQYFSGSWEFFPMIHKSCFMCMERG
jgi:hypothetical protein